MNISNGLNIVVLEVIDFNLLFLMIFILIVGVVVLMLVAFWLVGDLEWL